jgi:ankyrin repeat protein
MIKVLLLKKGAELDLKHKYGQTLLSWAAKKGHDAIEQLYLGEELRWWKTFRGL